MTTLDLLSLSGSVTATSRRRARAWRRAWALVGPVMPLALSLGLVAGSALALWRRM